MSNELKFPKKFKFGDEPAKVRLDEKHVTLILGETTRYSSPAYFRFKSAKEIDTAVDELLRLKWYLYQIGYFKR